MEVFQIRNHIRAFCWRSRSLFADVSGQKTFKVFPLLIFSMKERWGVRFHVCLWTAGLRLIYVKVHFLQQNPFFLLFFWGLCFYFFLYSVTMFRCQRSPGPLSVKIMIFSRPSLKKKRAIYIIHVLIWSHMLMGLCLGVNHLPQQQKLIAMITEALPSGTTSGTPPHSLTYPTLSWSHKNVVPNHKRGQINPIFTLFR